MSAESPRRVGVGVKGNASQIVLPQPVTDPSLIDSVAGFIQEVVPQAYSGSTGDSREVITWARVQQADINDPAFYPDTGDQDGVPPLLLVLGYGSGVQVWSVPVSGEAREVLSWSQGVVRTLCVLPSPEPRLPLRQDLYRHKRPLVAMVDNAGPGPQFCSVSFISLRDGDQVKSIKFSHQVWDVVANRRSVVITLAERIAVFDSTTLEDNLVVTTCYPSPDINPIALGSRWLAYADRRLVSQWRSLGGVHSEGPQSVTATVFHAAKFLGKGLRDLSGTVASSLTGGSPENTCTQTPEPCLKGIVTVLDIETKLSKDANEEDHQAGANRILAHFNAHFEPIIALSFDPSGMLLISADKRGHRFHVFRINTHPCSSTLAYVQHLYILHRGDTTARIQDIAFSADSRWVAISSMRGTTHVFPISPYGGPVGVRTHTTPHVVNKLSRFHRSAGLSDDGRNSPVQWDGPPLTPPLCHPSLPAPTTVIALAQVRRQSALVPPTEESIVRVAACFGAPRAPALAPHRAPGTTRRAMDSLYVMACNGSLIQYDLDPRHMSGVGKDKVCDDTSVELHVEARAQWILQRPPYSSSLHPPLTCTNPLLSQPDPPTTTDSQIDDERWLSQVEIITHAGPHRRLWMGPQFTFITISPNNESGETLDINKQVVRSNPVNMPLKQPLIIESGSCSSLELSPNMVELVYKTDCSWSCRLREDLAEAMLESPTARNTGVRGLVRREPVIERQVNPLGSVVTLTAQLSFPADLLSDNGKVTVVGTETKKITLESRSNNPITRNLIGECLLGKNVLDSCLRTQPANGNDLGASSLDLPIISSKVKQKKSEYENKCSKKILAEVDENISNSQKKSEDKESVVDMPAEKRGKSSKSRRKISKGEKNKPKVEVEPALSVDEFPTLSNHDLPVELSTPPVEIDLPVCEEVLQGSGDIEMQLREASAERDFEDKVFQEPEDCKGRKRSLDITAETQSTILASELIFDDQTLDNSYEDIKDNDKSCARQRKKSKINDQDAWLSVSEVKNVEKSEQKNDYDISILTDKSTKVEEKKSKKKKSKKSPNLNESVCEERKKNEVKKADDSEVELTMLDASQETLCPDTFQVSFEIEQQDGKKERTRNFSSEMTNLVVDTEVSKDHSLDIDNEVSEINSAEERNCATDDELKGFESDLLVKDCSWSPEKSPDRDTDILMDDKDSDKEVDKIKNYETTDKDSSDDCQPIIVKSDSKQAQRRGKNRKIMRKNREVESKVHDNEIKRDKEDFEKSDSSKEYILKSEEISVKQEKEERASLSKYEIDVNVNKVDSEEEELFPEPNKNLEEGKSLGEGFPDLQISSDGIKRRMRKKESPEKEMKGLQLRELDVPKRSWSSIVSSSSEDPNGNVAKPEEPLAPLRSWSSIAAGPAKIKSQDTEVMKNNSVEDRDSVYESCNDSVGEEVEPALDSLSSCYFEPETKDETEDPVFVSEIKQEEPFLESKSGSSVEDKSNTDSGEKDDLILGIQSTTKKTKKQKKKKR